MKRLDHHVASPAIEKPFRNSLLRLAARSHRNGSALQKTGGRLVTVEDHQLIGGMGAQLTHALVQAHIPVHLKSLGVHGEFGQSAYLADELYRKHSLGHDAIVAAALELLKSR